MKILIPVRFPLTETNLRAIERGIELANGHDNPELLIFHMNQLQNHQRIRRDELREAVESRFKNLNASYVIRDGFIVEEGIIGEATRLEVDYIVLSQHRRDRLEELLSKVFPLERKPVEILREKTHIEIEVIDESGNGTSNE